ncbi:MAG TPA: hypothetical protein VHC96_22805 [Puia sp.]|nr:hypothetical protein [Puia sp.]
MKWSLPLLLLLSSLASSGQKTPAPSGFTGGVEADVLPFLTGGYYMSVWGGYKHVRYRIVLTEVNTPQFLLPEKFSNNEIEAYALIADYFFHRDFQGCWIGTGLEWWKGQIDTRDASATGRYTAYLYTIGTGYVWNIYRGFYLNPWAGAHLKVGGDHFAHVGLLEYTPPLLTPEVSFKIGWHFQ